jgi:uncharacterized phage infection (PIP) family protein YhgE
MTAEFPAFAVRRVLERWFHRGTQTSQRQSIADAASELQRCHDSLLEFGRQSDSEFTALAKELAGFSSGLSALRSKASRLSSVIEERDESNALASAYSLYKGSVDLVHASLGVAVSEQEQMQTVEKQLLDACKARESFDRSDMMLRILTLNVRMEAVRLDPDQQSVFVNVVAAIEEIANKVMASSAKAFDRIECIVREASVERGELQQLEQALHQRAHKSVDTIFHELETLRTAMAPCGELSRGIEKRLDDSAPIITTMLMALQHQDIVRQKNEHIAVGFADIAERLPEAANGPGSAAAFVHQAAAVQYAQLVATREEISEAGASVTNGMTALVTHGEALLAEYSDLERLVETAFADCRLADLYREQITELAGIAALGQVTNEKVARSVARIREVVKTFSQEITCHEFDVKIVALNAQVAAARMTSAEALNKLSEECSRVSDEIRVVTTGLAKNLDDVLGALQLLSMQADVFLSIVSREKTNLEQGAITVSDQLRKLAEQIQEDATETGKQFAVLFQDTAALLQGLRFPGLIAASYGPAEAVCSGLQEATAGSGQLPLDTDAESKLAAHRSRYTMEEERRAHAKALGAATVASAKAPAADIELFDMPPPQADPPKQSAVVAPQSTEPSSSTTPSEPSKPDLGPGVELF